MLLAYLDESYTTERYFIAAVIVPEASARPLDEALENIVTKASLSYGGLDRETELHAHELVAGIRGWKPMHPVLRARIGIYHDAIQAIVDHRAEVILRGVHSERLRARYSKPDHPHSVVLTHLIERIDEHAEARDELALMIADQIDKEDTHRRNLWFCQRNGTWGYRGHAITRVVDTLHFAPSKASRLLQAADMVAYLGRRHFAHTETNAQAKREWGALWERLQPAVWHAQCWLP